MRSKLVSSSAKVFPDLEPKEYEYRQNRLILKGDSFFYQVAYTTDRLNYNSLVKVKVVSDIKKYINIINFDGYSTSSEFAKAEDIFVKVIPNYWKSLQIIIHIPNDVELETMITSHKIELQFIDKSDKVIDSLDFTVDLINIEYQETEAYRHFLL